MNFERLRALVLERAAQGNLVSQLESEPETAQLGDAPQRFPIEIPGKWKWVKLSELVTEMADGPFGSNLKKEHYTLNREARIIQLSNIGERGWRNENVKYTTFEHAETISRSKVNSGDIVIAKMMPAGRAIIVPPIEKAFVLSSDAVKVVVNNKYCLTKYLNFAINSNVFKNQVYSNVQGTTRIRTSVTKLKNYYIPLPSLEEQARVVAKVEESLADIDRAEKAYEELQTLAGVLRGQILQEAIEGKLVPQLAEEGVVEQIGAAPEEVPFEIPEKWKWYYLGSVIEYGKSNQVSGDEITSQTWVLDLEDIEKNTGRILEKKRGVSSTSNKNKFESGYVLYSKLRPYLNKVVVADEAGVCTTEIVPINVNGASVPLDAKYLQTYLMSPFFVNYANQASYGVKMPRLGTKDARAALIPIPPLEEQKRIVQKVVELLSQTDSLAGC